MKVVILCGGSGTRLWPISRKQTPKQFIPLFDSQTLFQMTQKRNLPLAKDSLIIVNEQQLDLCKKQLVNNNSRFLIESVGRNTAPAVALAALCCSPEELMLILPSDHLIKDQNEYENCVRKAQELAKAGHLVTFGIQAQYPETGYGYIQSEGNDVIAFKEKPDYETAKQYVESKKYFWNSGMFCFKAKTFLDELNRHAPDVYNACLRLKDTLEKGDDDVLLTKDLLCAIPAVSVDYAVMEKSDNVKVVPSSFYWTDLGSFDSLAGELESDSDGNNKNSHYYQVNSHRNLVISEKKVVATFDVDDLIIVDTSDALVVGKKGNTQKVKDLLAMVEHEHPELAK